VLSLQRETACASSVSASGFRASGSRLRHSEPGIRGFRPELAAGSEGDSRARNFGHHLRRDPFFGGLSLLLKPAAKLAALVLTINFIVWLLLLRVPNVVAGWSHAGAWLGFGETLLVVTGAWAILVSLNDESDGRGLMGVVGGSAGLRLARLLFGIAVPMIGLSHFVYLEATVNLVPAYLPHREFFAWLTARDISPPASPVLFGVLPRLAAMLEGIMMGLFALMVWAPKLVAHPTSRFLWDSLSDLGGDGGGGASDRRDLQRPGLAVTPAKTAEA